MINRTILLIVVLHIIILISCGKGKASKQNGKLMLPVSQKESTVQGSVMEVEGGIYLLIENRKNNIKRSILVAGNDSIKEIVQCAYESRLDSGCRIQLTPWIQLGGYYIRKDSLRSAFLFKTVAILDDGSTCSLIAEE